VDAHPGTIYDAYARMLAYTTVCEASMGDTGILRHSSTASHARDMLEILHQLGEEKLKYWGFSYGTVLGGTFAAMYPDKVERLVSDGNVDYREWHEKTHLNFLHDTDNVMQAFFDLCHRAGPDVCAFYASSPDAIKTRLETLFANLKVHPVVVPADKELGPEIPDIVTYSRVRKVLSSTLYQPQRAFPWFAKTLLALEKGDGRPFYEQTAGKTQPAAICQVETIPPTTPLTGFDEGTEDAFGAIMCSDSVPLPNSIDAFVKIINDYEQMSYAAGATNANFPIACVGRQVRPKWRFSGMVSSRSWLFSPWMILY
jgi:pimeloyl-ACP methyl ester carboxylesterase